MPDMAPDSLGTDRIKQLRRLLIVHSFIYYRLCTSLVSDYKWQAWADELVTLQYPGPVSIGYYDDYFGDWNGDTGMHLPQDPWVHGMAEYLLWLHDKYHAYNPPLAQGTFD